MPGVGDAFGTALSLVVCGLAAGLPLLVILHAWLVDKTLGPVEGVLSVSGVVLVLGLVVTHWGSIVSLLLLGGLVAGTALLPLLSHWVNQRGLTALDQEDIEKYHRTLDFDPNNAAAHSYLGQIYFRQGRLEEAIHHLQRAVELDPRSSQDRWHLERALRAQTEKEGSFVVCPECRTQNPVGAKTCGHCETPLHGSGFLHWVVRPENAKRVAGIGLAVYAGLLILGWICRRLPGPFDIVFLFGTLAVGGFMAYRYWNPKPHGR